MDLRRIRYKLLLVVGITLGATFGGLALYYMHSAQESILAENQRSLHKVTDSVSQAIASIMLENHAEIMKEYSVRLKKLDGIADFTILRTDGTEAFRDNRTIDAVNRRLGRDAFEPRAESKEVPIQVDTAQPAFQQAVTTGMETSYEMTDGQGHRFQVFLDPIANGPRCASCHGHGHTVRGVLKLTSSLAGVEKEILQVRVQSLLLLALSLGATMLITGYMLGRSVVRPIEHITHAMTRISSGDFDHSVPVQARDELGRMAESFNRMTSELKSSYGTLLREKDKLTTIIQSAREAIVVTDSQGEIVLVNPAAEQILDKPLQRIRDEGFLQLLDDPALMQRAVENGGDTENAETVVYKERALLISAAAIVGQEGEPIGSAALIRDVTDEKRLITELQRISITDALTGIFNRRHLDERLKLEFERGDRGSKPLSVILFDVDHFKKFNDTHGHDQGDRVLQTMGRVMKSVLRQYDLPCRYGGEEFVAILPSADSDGAAAVAERLRRQVEETEVDGLRVTISLGVATYPDLPVSQPKELLEAADAALYRAKEAGRNRVMVAAADPVDKEAALT